MLIKGTLIVLSSAFLGMVCNILCNSTSGDTSEISGSYSVEQEIARKVLLEFVASGYLQMNPSEIAKFIRLNLDHLKSVYAKAIKSDRQGRKDLAAILQQEC